MQVNKQNMRDKLTRHREKKKKVKVKKDEVFYLYFFYQERIKKSLPIHFLLSKKNVTKKSC